MSKYRLMPHNWPKQPREIIACALCLCVILCGCAVPPAPNDGPIDITPSIAATPIVPDVVPTPDDVSVINPDPLINDPILPGEVYKSRVNSLNYRSAPSAGDDGNIIGQLGYEDEVYLLENQGEFSLVELLGGTRAYCYSSYIVPAEETLYAYLTAETAQKIDIPTGEPVFEKDGVTPVMVKNELIDLRLYLPDAEYELLFATKRNVIGEPLYPRAIPLLQKDVAEKMQKVFDVFKADGYTLKIYDAYRPLSVQRRLYDAVGVSKWIANPSTTASNHNRGCALDISLIDDATGLELEFPTPMHSFIEESARTSKSWGEEARKNVDYITGVMEQFGFAGITSEWWHFADVNSKNYMTTDLDLSRLNMLPKQEDNT